MPQQTGSDPFLDALSDVRQSGPPAHGIRLSGPPDPFLVALEDVKAEATGQPAPQDTRSRFAQVVDTLSEPLIPQIATGARSVSDWMTTPKLYDSRALAMTKGALGGLVEGAGNVVAGFTSPLGIAAAVSGVGAEKAAASELLNAARALRGVEAASGAAFGARGLEQAVSAPTVAEKALGVAQAAAGALGVRGGVQGYQRIGSPAVEAARPVRGALRRGVRGELPPGPRFIGQEVGPVADRVAGQLDPFISALEDVRRPSGRDQSRVRSVSAAPIDYRVEGQRAVPSQFSGDVNAMPAARPVIRAGQPIAPRVEAPPVVAAPIEPATPARPAVPTRKEPRSVRAEPVEVEQLTDDELRELRRIHAEMDNFPYVAKTFNQGGARQGGNVEVVGGSGGARVFYDIVGGDPEGRRPAFGGSRSEVTRKIADFVQNGKRSVVSDLAVDVARRRLAGDRTLSAASLPPSAGEPAVRVDRLTNLAPAQASIQARVAAAVESNPRGYAKAYRERFGNVVSADNAKELFPQYSASNAARTANDLAVHRPAAALARKVYTDLLREHAPEGKADLVLFTGGGTGAGKTSGLGEVLPELRDSAQIVYDSTLSNTEGAIRDIDAALDAGKQVGVVFTDRDLGDAFRATLARAGSEGRPVTLNTHVRSHIKANETFQALQARYGDHIEYVLLRNGPEGRRVANLSDWKPRVYNESDARTVLTDILEQERGAGRVSPALYEAVRAKAPTERVAREGGPGRTRPSPATETEVATPTAPSSELSVQDFAQALSREGQTPIADAPFSLTPEAAEQPGHQPSMLGAGVPESQTFPAQSDATSKAAIKAAKQRAADAGGEAFIVREGNVDVVTSQQPKGAHLRVFPDGKIEPSAVRRTRGEEGAVSPELAARLGLGGAGAVYGAATGEDTTDRLERAAIFGAAGALAPSLLKRGGPPAGVVMTRAGRAGLRQQVTRETPAIKPEGARVPVPPGEPLTRAQALNFASIEKMPEPIRNDILDLLEQHGGFGKQRRGVQPVERTEAQSLRMSVPLEKLKPGTVLRADELAAYRDALASVMTDRLRLAERVKAGTATDAERLKFSELTDRATVLLSSYQGAKAEAGRSLNILRAKARVLQYGDTAFIEKALQAPGFAGDLDAIAKAVTEAGGDPLKQLDALRAATRPSKLQIAQGAYYNSLLSGPKTHLRNLLGNSFNMLANLATPAGAVPMDIARSKVTGAPRTVYLGELPHQMIATGTALPQAFRDAVFTVRHGFSPRTVAEAAAGKFDVVYPELPGGIVTNLPSRALQAADTFFRTLAYQQELNAGAYAAVRREGVNKPAAIATRMSELIAGDSPEALDLQKRAETFAARAVFQEEPGPVLSRLVALKNDPELHPAWRLAMTFTIPFVKTPGNILRQGAEFSPAGFKMKAAKAGGREGAQALGRAALGSVVLMPLAYLAATGRLSGNGPTDRGDREALLETGWQPNSVKIGSQWVKYNTFQPLSIPLSAVANAWDRFAQSDRSDRSAEESAFAALSGAAASFLDNSFLAGLNALLDAIGDPDRSAKRFFAQLAQGMVPGSGFLRGVTQAIDPTVRQPEGAVESIKAIIPGVSDEVPARLDRFGRPVMRPGGPLQRGFMVPEVSPEKSDPVGDLLKRLDVAPEPPRAVVSWRGQRMPLSRDDEYTIRQAIGQERYAKLSDLLRTAAFGRINEQGQKRVVQNIIRDASEAIDGRARALLLRKQSLTLAALRPRQETAAAAR
jgi:hypothetical protein